MPEYFPTRDVSTYLGHCPTYASDCCMHTAWTSSSFSTLSVCSLAAAAPHPWLPSRGRAAFVAELLHAVTRSAPVADLLHAVTRAAPVADLLHAVTRAAPVADLLHAVTRAAPVADLLRAVAYIHGFFLSRSHAAYSLLS